MGCPVDFPGVGVQVVSGAAIGAARALELKSGWQEKPAMYAGIVSRPGTTKSAALRAVMTPLYEEQERLHEDYLAAVRRFEADKAAYRPTRRKQSDERIPAPPELPPPVRHLFASDVTREELGNILNDSRKGILLFRDELTAWVRSMDEYKGRGSDRQFFLSAWSGEPVKVDRVGRHGQPIIIPRPFLSVLGGIPPDLLSELQAEGKKQDGFLHRILFSWPSDMEIASWTDTEISTEDELEWRLILGRLLSLEPQKVEGSSERPRVLRFSPTGRQAFIEWFNAAAREMNDEDFPLEQEGPYAKLRSYCARFALVLHLLRVACAETTEGAGEGEVDAEDVHGAAKLCDYFRAHGTAVCGRLQQSPEDGRVEDLLRWLRKKNLRRCTPRDICRANLCGIKTASEAQKLLKAAIDRGLGDSEGTDGTKRQGRSELEVHAFLLKEGI
jgi:hypothetical protein